MINLSVFEYNNNQIQVRQSDGFVNLTQMCQANGKRIDNFLRLKQTQDYISVLGQSLRCEVVESEIGGSNPCTWGHPSAAINLARWISSEFAVWCDAHIFNLMTKGSTSLKIDPIEEMRLKMELMRLETECKKYDAQGKQADLQLIQFRHIVTTTLPEPTQQKILGFKVIKDVEYNDRIIHNSEIVNDGTTAMKTELCKRYGFLTKNGKPDYKALNAYLEQLPSEAFRQSVRFQENLELRRDYIPALDEIIENSSRQRWVGE